MLLTFLGKCLGHAVQRRREEWHSHLARAHGRDVRDTRLASTVAARRPPPTSVTRSLLPANIVPGMKECYILAIWKFYVLQIFWFLVFLECLKFIKFLNFNIFMKIWKYVKKVKSNSSGKCHSCTNVASRLWTFRWNIGRTNIAFQCDVYVQQIVIHLLIYWMNCLHFQVPRVSNISETLILNDNLIYIPLVSMAREAQYPSWTLGSLTCCLSSASPVISLVSFTV